MVKVRVGLLYDLANPPEWYRDPVELYRYELQQAIRAEQLGIDGIWVTEHHFTHGYICSPLVFLGALATGTTSVRLGTAVLLPDLYHPVRLAEDIAVLDVLSNGRVELGVGIGSILQEYECFGVNPKQRVSVLRESLEILRLAWSAEEFTYRGKHFDLGKINVVPKPVQQPHPPILGGATSIAGARRVGRWGLPLQWIDRDIGEAYLEAFAESGQPLERATIDGYINLFLCDDPVATWEVAREHYRYQSGRNIRYGLKSVNPSGDVSDRSLPTMDDVERRRAEGALLLLTPDQAIDEIEKRTRGLPVSGLFCHNRICGMPDDLSERHVELMATAVKPAIQSLGSSL
jgi:alkanesulfonate monooxygenase SsuD/methylene tetrahydromethanopterin reductase-like flavin-dependent oxidoreductase (luciferase family)